LVGALAGFVVGLAQAGRGLVRRAGCAIRRHWLFAAFVFLAVGLRVAVSIAYWPGLELFGDSYDYLRVARVVQPGHWNPSGYPLFLALLAVTGRFWVVVVVQHLVGITTGVLVYMLVLRLGVRRWLAAIAALPVLLDGYQLDIEQFILPETLVELLLIAGLTLLLWREKISPWRGAMVGLLLAAATLTRTAILPVLAVVGVYLLVRGGRWRTLVAYCAVAALALVGYGGWFAATYGYVGYSDNTGYWLYGRVAPFATCDYRLPAREALLCPKRPVLTRPHSSEFWTWDPRSPLTWRPGLGFHHQRNLLAERFAIDIIEHQPLAYAGAVISDIWHYFTPGRWMTADRVSMRRWRFPPPHIHPNVDAYHVSFANKGFTGTITPSPDPALMGPLRTYQSFFYTPGPAFLACLVAALVAGFGLARGCASRRHARWGGLVLAVSGLAVVVTPSLGLGFSYRYGLPLLVLLPPAGAVGADIALGALARRRPLATYARLAVARHGAPGRASCTMPSPEVEEGASRRG
jgi:hypothetical protein